MNLLNYDTIFFDLDWTIWYGIRPLFYPKSMTFPYRVNDDKVLDVNGDFIELFPKTREMLSFLREKNKNLGFITRGGLLNCGFDSQPPVICLRLFKLYDYFNIESYALWLEDRKSRVIKQIGKTLFIDDSDKDLEDMRTNRPDIHVLDRKTVQNWSEIYAN
jgi:predicted phosphatase